MASQRSGANHENTRRTSGSGESVDMHDRASPKGEEHAEGEGSGNQNGFNTDVMEVPVLICWPNQQAFSTYKRKKKLKVFTADRYRVMRIEDESKTWLEVVTKEILPDLTLDQKNKLHVFLWNYANYFNQDGALLYLLSHGIKDPMLQVTNDASSGVTGTAVEHSVKLLTREVLTRQTLVIVRSAPRNCTVHGEKFADKPSSKKFGGGFGKSSAGASGKMSSNSSKKNRAGSVGASVFGNQISQYTRNVLQGGLKQHDIDCRPPIWNGSIHAYTFGNTTSKDSFYVGDKTSFGQKTGKEFRSNMDRVASCCCTIISEDCVIGSGFAISGNYLITAEHVIPSTTDTTLTCKFYDEDETFSVQTVFPRRNDGKLNGKKFYLDVCVLHVAGRKKEAPRLPIDKVTTKPLLKPCSVHEKELQKVVAFHGDGSCVNGSIVGLRDYEVFYTCATESTFSGGPIVTHEGQVIGVHRRRGEEPGSDIRDVLFNAGIRLDLFLQTVFRLGTVKQYADDSLKQLWQDIIGNYKSDKSRNSNTTT